MEYLSYPEVAELLGLQITRVHQLVRDGELIYVVNAEESRRIPADFIQDGLVLKSLPQVIRLLRDARFSDEEILDWLYRADESIPGTPVNALRENRGTEIKRRAQAAGY
jgi:predicted DNA-binding transcriptional regulator AlpA